MKKLRLFKPVIGLFLAMFCLNHLQAQCDVDQVHPADCSCIYFCHSEAVANNNCGITLNWTTVTEPSIGGYFKIFRAPITGTTFTLIATIQATHPGSQGGSYTYIDNNPTNPDGNEVYYYIQFFNNDGLLREMTPRRSAIPTCAVPNACNNTTTTTTYLTGKTGSVIVLRLSFGGYVNWNNSANGAGATISISCAGQTGSTGSTHYYGSGSFSLSQDITITMPSGSTPITTIAVVHNSTTMLTSTATISIISVNGVSQTTQAVVCGGNSQGTNW